jgi:regulator of telomere elongation helicase 1
VDAFTRAEPDFGAQEPVDIEDLVKLGERGRVGGGCGPCPYYLALSMQERADIIFMPYNYLIDPRLREQMGANIPWKGAVLLFDEAHNIEGVCADAASFDISAAHLAAAVQEAQEAFEIAAAEEEGIGGGGEKEKETLKFNARGRDADDGYGGGGAGGTGGVNAEAQQQKRKALEYKQLRGVLLALEGKIAGELAQAAEATPSTSTGGAPQGAPGGGGFPRGGPNKAELVRPGEALFTMLASLRIVEEGAMNSKQMLLDVIKDAVLLLAGEVNPDP